MDALPASVNVISLQPNDVVLLTLPSQATPEQIDNIIDYWSATFPNNKVVAITENIGVSVFRPAFGVDADAATVVSVPPS